VWRAGLLCIAHKPKTPNPQSPIPKKKFNKQFINNILSSLK
jgi:hypothetical protein